MARTAEAVFYDGGGRVRCVTEILNVSDRSYSASNYKNGSPCYLNDPYEGELFVHFLCMQLSSTECDSIWQFKAPQLRSGLLFFLLLLNDRPKKKKLLFII